MYIKIIPHDTLFFRDGKPFNSGEETWANTAFMPNPSVLWGAVASLFFVHNVSSQVLKQALILKEIYIYHEETGRLYLPAPRDLFIDRNGRISHCVYKKNDEKLLSCIELPYYVFPDTEEEVESLDNFYIDISSICNEYFRQKGTPCFLSAAEIAAGDYKVGITRSRRTNSSDEGKLYRVDLLQFKASWGFLLEIDKSGIAEEIPEKGFLKLGGEGKAAEYCFLKESPCSLTKFKSDLRGILKENSDTHYYRILLTTPAILQGSYADIFNEINSPNMTFRLEAAAVGKTFSVGGFDMEAKRPKAMQRGIPAGSVFTVQREGQKEISQAEVADILRKSFAPCNKNRGFGGIEILPL